MNTNVSISRALWNWLGQPRGIYNSNDDRSGRNQEPPSEDADRPSEEQPPRLPPQNNRPNGQRPNQGPPDLDELWRDFNRKLGRLFGANQGGGGNRMPPLRPPGGGGGKGGFKPDMKNAGFGLGLLAVAVVLVWLGSGFFIVREGEQAVITEFGRYDAQKRPPVGAGLHWRMPYPIQRHESVVVSQIRSADVGQDDIVQSTGLRDSAMLTADENIVEIKFAVQYRLNNPGAWLFTAKVPDETVVQVAEAAVREVVGKMKMDAALGEEREQIAPRVRALMQSILDRYNVGVEIVDINLQQGGVRPPEQVQAAFDDVLKAGQESERVKNEAQAYANNIVPCANGTASRLKAQAEAYKAQVVNQAQGDTERFNQILTQYQKAPQVTRDRIYIDTMQQIYGSTAKILIDSHQNSNLLYLPLDKLAQVISQTTSQTAQNQAAQGGQSSSLGCSDSVNTVAAPAAPAGAGAASTAASPASAPDSFPTDDTRSRSGRSRDSSDLR
ncbi:MAG: FtsH protease activity modulator HflK [Burkholderiaceae bacterium]|nr:FtsH protease activity modulator HflK [Burkholderiaceae bacterium]